MIPSRKVQVIYGPEAVNKNAEMISSLGDSFLIVTGRNSARLSGALPELLQVIGNKEYQIFDKISENPRVSDILEAGKLLTNCDCVIGIGGGSVLDAAKVIACLKNNPVSDEEALYKQQWPQPGLPLVLIGTTAGTGSEVTKVAVLSRENGRKASIHHDRFYATRALCDPRYTYSQPPEIAISTAVDALTHCAESYFNNKATDESRDYAIIGLRKLLPALRHIKQGLSDAEKDEVYAASLYGGLAIDITGTTFAHNVGYYLTENFHVHHGYACAVFEEDLIDFEYSNDQAYAHRFFDLIGMDKDEYVKLVNSLLPEMDITISPETLQAIMPRWYDNNSVRNTYGQMKGEDIEKILRKKFVR